MGLETADQEMRLFLSFAVENSMSDLAPFDFPGESLPTTVDDAICSQIKTPQGERDSGGSTAWDRTGQKD